MVCEIEADDYIENENEMLSYLETVDGLDDHLIELFNPLKEKADVFLQCIENANYDGNIQEFLCNRGSKNSSCNELII